MADGNTDHSVTEQEHVYVRYINEEGLLETELADIVSVKCADATGIFDVARCMTHTQVQITPKLG